jgi:hypothetical protein
MVDKGRRPHFSVLDAVPLAQLRKWDNNYVRRREEMTIAQKGDKFPDWAKEIVQHSGAMFLGW